MRKPDHLSSIELPDPCIGRMAPGFQEDDLRVFPGQSYGKGHPRRPGTDDANIGLEMGRQRVALKVGEHFYGNPSL
jgi:hypothetical protein